MTYTLRDYYEEAALQDYPAWASQIGLHHPAAKEFRPRWSQIEGLNLAFSYPNLRSALFDEQGTGKTLPSQAFALWQAGMGNRCLCIMPRVLLRQYEQSFWDTFKGFNQHVRCEVYYGNPKVRSAQVVRWKEYGAPEIVLATYDTLRDEWALFRALDFNALIMDESKVLGNETNRAYIAAEQFMGRLGERYALVLNGTPLKNDLRAAYGYINFLTPGIYKNRLQFELHHVIYQKIKTQFKNAKGLLTERKAEVVAGYRNVTKMHENLYAQARRVDKSILNLPALTETMLNIELDPQHIEAYKTLVRERLLFTESGVIDATATATRRAIAAKAVVHPEELNLPNAPNMVLEAIDEILEEVDTASEEGKKVFILAHYQKTVELLMKHYKKLQPAVIYGKTKDSGAEANRFKTDPKCRILIANYAAGGVGLNLQDVCHIAICAEPSTVPGDYAQARDRLHRGGQVNPVTMYLIVPRGTLFVKMYRDREEKQDHISRVIDGTAWERELLGEADECFATTD